MRALLIAFVLLTVAGCASVAKVESGEQAIGERLVIHLEGAWNHVKGPGAGPAQIWTMEGLPVDQLLIYSGVKNGDAIHEPDNSGKRKNFSFRADMQPDDVVAMFEGMFTRDGSTFKLAKLEPSSFGGQKGFRFEYLVTRKVDNVQLSGVGYGTVSKGELFALVYAAPRLGFFSRHQQKVEQIARSAKVKL